MAGFIVSTLGSGEGSVSIFEDALKFLLEFLSLISTTESFFTNDGFKVEFSTDLISNKLGEMSVSKIVEKRNAHIYAWIPTFQPIL